MESAYLLTARLSTVSLYFEQSAGAKASQTNPAQSPTTTPARAKRSVSNKEPSQTEEEPAGYVTLRQESNSLYFTVL